MAAPKNISLIPREGFEYTTTGRVLGWAVSAGRVIVVITELVVILAFLSRFWLDRQLTNLNEQIKQRVTLIHASENFEQQFRTTQSKLATFTQITQAPNSPAILEQILNLVPQDVVATQALIDRSRAQITGLALSERGLATFMKNLEEQKLGEVVITQASIASQEQTGIRFTLDVNFAKEKEQK